MQPVALGPLVSACAAIVVLNASGVVGWLVRAAWHWFAREAAKVTLQNALDRARTKRAALRSDSSQGDLIAANQELAKRKADLRNVDTLRQTRGTLDIELNLRRPGGGVVGSFEGCLYLYALFSGVESIISGVLLFKAFSAWVSAGSGPTTEPSSADARAMPLRRYYGYAIGNFISLLVCVVLFEATTRLWLALSAP